MSQDRGTLRTTIRRILGETSGLFWKDPILDQWMEDSLLDIALKTKCNRTRGLLTTVASTMEYTLSSNITDMIDIVGPVRIYDGTNSSWRREMEGMTRDRMDIEFPGWEKATNTGEPTMYFYDIKLDKLWIFQPPSSQYAGTDYLRIPYASKPAATSEDTDSPDVPEILYPAIVEFVVARGMESRGYHDIAQSHWKTYGGHLNTYNAMGEPGADVDIIMRVR